MVAVLVAVPAIQQQAMLEWRAGLSFRTNGMSGISSVPEEPGTQALSLFRHDVFVSMRQSHLRAPESPLSKVFAFAPLREINTVLGQQAEVIISFAAIVVLILCTKLTSRQPSANQSPRHSNSVAKLAHSDYLMRPMVK